MNLNQNKQKFGDSNLVFFSEVPTIQAAEIASVKKHKEAEGPELDVKGLAKSTTNKIQQRRESLKELPASFNKRLKKEIVKYITNSPDRFESDENKGLSAKEFASFKKAMLSKVGKLVERYAPTKEEIAAKKETKKSAERAKKAAENIEDIDLGDIEDNPGDIKDLPTLANKFTQFDQWNSSLQSEGSKLITNVSKFQKTFAEFTQARNGLEAYKKFGNYFGGKDPQITQLRASKKAMESTLKKTRNKLKKAQKKLDKYGGEMGKASNEQKQEKIKERDAHIKRIEEDDNLSEKEKANKKAEYKKLAMQKDSLNTQKKNLSEYKKQVETTKQTVVKDRIKNAETRKEQLTNYGTILSASLEELDRLIDNPEISEQQKQDLAFTRAQIAEKKGDISLGAIGAETVLSNNRDNWNLLTDEERKIGEQEYSLDAQIKHNIEPLMGTLNEHIGILDSAMIQYTDSKEEVMKHYENAFKIYDNIDESVDNSVLNNSLANVQVENALSNQQKAIGRMKIEEPSGVGGFFEATLGAGLSTAGGAISYAGDWMLTQAEDLQRELEIARKDGMHPAKYWAARVATEIYTAPIGVAGGLFEIAGGLVTMVGNPIDTVNGLGALIGRNPATGEWWDGTGGETWKSMGKAIISWEHFSKGHIGVGIGKIFTNIVTTIVGGGAVSAGGKAAIAATKAARAAGIGTIKAIGIGVRQGAIIGGKAFGKDIAKGVKGIKGVTKGAIRTPGKMIRGSAKDFVKNAASRGKHIMTGFVDDLVTGLKTAPKNSKAWFAARSKLAKKLFGEESAIKGLSKKENKLLSDIEAGAGDYAKFQKQHEKISKSNPHLTDAEIRFRIMKEDYHLYEAAIKLEKKISQAIKIRSGDVLPDNQVIAGKSYLEKKKIIEEGGLDKPGKILDEFGWDYEAYLDRYDKLAAKLGTKDDAMITRILAQKHPRLHEQAMLLQEMKPGLAKNMRYQQPSIDKLNQIYQTKGVKHALKEVYDGNAPLTEKLLNRVLKNKEHTELLIKVIKERPNIKLEWRLGSKNAISNRILKAEAIGNDAVQISHVVETLGGKSGAKLLDKAFAKVKSGEILPTDDIARALEKLKERDPKAYKLLENSDKIDIIESDCLEAVIRGNKIETMGQQGPITIYVGKRNLGQGGFGSVDEILFYRKGESKLTRGAYKKVHDEANVKKLYKLEDSEVAAKEKSLKKSFEGERRDSLKVQEWNHKNIIEILDIGDDFIITETGSRAVSLEKSVGKFDPDIVFDALDQAVDGVEAIWKEGYFHGDIKGPNILIFEKNGQRVVKVIDHTPSSLEAMSARAYTEGFAYTYQELAIGLTDLVKKGNLTSKQQTHWLSRAQDAKALAVTTNMTLGQFVKVKGGIFLPEQQMLIKRMQAITKRAENVVEAGNPQFLLDLKSVIKDIKTEFVRCKTDPTRVQFANRLVVAKKTPPTVPKRAGTPPPLPQQAYRRQGIPPPPPPV